MGPWRDIRCCFFDNIFELSQYFVGGVSYTCQRKKISCSLASYKCAYCGLNTQSDVGLSVCATNLMEYCIETFCLRWFLEVVRLLLLVVIQQVMFWMHRALVVALGVQLDLTFVGMIFWLNHTQCYHNQASIVSRINRDEGRPCDHHPTRSLIRLLAGWVILGICLSDILCVVKMLAFFVEYHSQKFYLVYNWNFFAA